MIMIMTSSMNTPQARGSSGPFPSLSLSVMIMSMVRPRIASFLSHDSVSFHANLDHDQRAFIIAVASAMELQRVQQFGHRDHDLENPHDLLVYNYKQMASTTTTTTLFSTPISCRFAPTCKQNGPTRTTRSAGTSEGNLCIFSLSRIPLANAYRF